MDTDVIPEEAMAMVRAGRGGWVRALAVLILAGQLGACDRPDADVDFGGEDLGPDRFSVLSDGGELKMGLTDQVVYFALSDSVVAAARSEMEEQKNKEGLGGLIGGIVSNTVGKALGFRAKYPVEEIRDIRWENGHMVVEFEDGDRRLEGFEIDDREVTEAFREDDVEAFGEQFRQAKAELEAGEA